MVLAAVIFFFRQTEFSDYLGLSLYTMGGSLYFFNITILLNKQFTRSVSRLKGNYLNQVFLNGGALIGSVFIVYLTSIKNDIFGYSVVVVGFAVLILLFNYKKLAVNEEKQKTGLFLLHVYIIIATISIYFLFLKIQYTETSAVFIFALFFLYVAFYSKVNSDRKLVRFIVLVFLFSLPYWVATVVIYNQFFIMSANFLKKFHGISPMLIILLDPLINVVFGVIWIRFNRRKPSAYKSFFWSSFFIITGFFLFSIAIKTEYAFLMSCSMIVLFSCSQFLIQSGMNMLVASVNQTKRGMLLGLSLLRSVRLPGAFVGLCFIEKTVKVSSYNNMGDIYGSLYALLAVFFLFSILVLTHFFKKIHLLD